MAVTQISDTVANNIKKSQTKTFNNSMDKDGFLNLLVTQLRNQNPLEPTKDAEFISQMAQFSALEQAQNTNLSTRKGTANAMISKEVVATHKNETTNETYDVTGVVKKVKTDKDKIYLTLDVIGKDNKITSEDVLLDEVNEVTDLVSPLEQAQIMNQNLKLSYTYNMIGKEVKASHYDPATKKNIDVAGKAEKFRVDKNQIYVTINGTEVNVEEVYEVK